VKDLQKGFSISILVHILILCAVCVVWIDKPVQRRTISLDFSILNFETHGDRAGAQTGERHTGRKEVVKSDNKIERPNAAQANAKIKVIETAVDHSSITPPSSAGSAGILSDKDGQVEVFGKEGSFVGHEGSRTGNASLANIGQSSGGGQDGGNEGRTIRYGSGSANEKTFNYIREDILKNVRYPEKARRKGLQGKITLSFMVTEAGLTRDIKVINGSGFSELDNSAKEAIKLTTFTQRIPYKLFVILPVEYRLE
jgi:TonB family protein